MWQELLGGPWPDETNLLPPPVQRKAAAEIQKYWRLRAWQIALGELLLWAAAEFQEIAASHVYLALALCVTLVYALGFTRYTRLWLIGSVALLLSQGMLIGGLGAVTALTVIIPYTFAGMLLNGHERIFVQVVCVLAFWASLVYEILPVFPQLYPPSYILVSYNILLAAFVFQTLRFLNQLAVQINSAFVEEQVRLQSQQFLARVSHELRTPLNSVLGFAKLLRRGEFTETQSGYLDHIIEESTQLNRLVSDLLDSAHLSTGKLTLNLETVNLNDICAAVANEHRPTLGANVTLNTNLAPTLPPIQADQVRLRQIIGNLVSNAVKYTSQGEILIRTHQHGDRIFVTIKDTGIGIPESQQAMVFVPFVQLDNRKIGVGLGLDIALQLAKLHGGDIKLTSAPNVGSTFTLELPL